MRKRLAFVLGGGGARGALQAGALRALLEADIKPDLWVGTSAGAINAAFLAMRGFNQDGLSDLVSAWENASKADLLPSNYLWLTVRTLFNRTREIPYQRIREFFVSHGLDPTLRFKDLSDTRLYMVSAELNSRRCLVFGEDPEQTILEGLLASTALPPWVNPIEIDGRMVMDGGVVSDLPIEPAIRQGAQEIIALDISDHRLINDDANRFAGFLMRLIATISQRQLDLELALAEAQGVPVHHIRLSTPEPVPLWDFSRTDELISEGYQTARDEINRLNLLRKRRWWDWLTRLR